jgi:hypothetical protein
MSEKCRVTSAKNKGVFSWEVFLELRLRFREDIDFSSPEF